MLHFAMLREKRIIVTSNDTRIRQNGNSAKWEAPPLHVAQWNTTTYNTSVEQQAVPTISGPRNSFRVIFEAL